MDSVSALHGAYRGNTRAAVSLLDGAVDSTALTGGAVPIVALLALAEHAITAARVAKRRLAMAAITGLDAAVRPAAISRGAVAVVTCFARRHHPIPARGGGASTKG
ncbi:Hypothetical protein AA314_02860 [Archangium gephyra]|uniref:Uncharacterized protein n=1 Tax=Archangium gephyra TaxID=48 RepID=A0AAC8Q507_9BACT|nr:Hypothetical protein AA314_02860 [Archangium gephyra]